MNKNESKIHIGFLFLFFVFSFHILSMEISFASFQLFSYSLSKARSTHKDEQYFSCSLIGQFKICSIHQASPPSTTTPLPHQK